VGLPSFQFHAVQSAESALEAGNVESRDRQYSEKLPRVKKEILKFGSHQEPGPDAVAAADVACRRVGDRSWATMRVSMPHAALLTVARPFGTQCTHLPVCWRPRKFTRKNGSTGVPSLCTVMARN
jgi:hypothetical protein